MSLGSIAHLQYYFARTGLLDGKGGQMARESRKPSGSLTVTTVEAIDILPSREIGYLGSDIVNSPMEEEDSGEWDTSVMLPPTVSTYSHRTPYIPPPPDAVTMKRDLQDGLLRVDQAIAEVRRHNAENKEQADNDASAPEVAVVSPANSEDSQTRSSPSQGWYELEGLHILDVTTLAIRSAKIYYTMHENPQRLAIIKSERHVREELLGVLDTLRRSANRNFAGGIREDELQVISNWVASVEDFLAKEEAIEEREAKDRENWQWLEGTWDGQEQKREWLFMKTFLEGDELPEWTSPDLAETLPTPFLSAICNGLTLVHLHNRILKKSKRQFGDIKTFHTDTKVPYRAAENLRYWIKAAEIRWETKLQVDVLGVVYSKGDDVWKVFDAAVMKWCRAVREEITKEWKQGSVRVSSTPPPDCSS
jgi:hypothetical protein